VSSRATAVRESPEPDAAVLDDAAPASESDRVDEVDGADDSDVADATDVDATDGDAVDADADAAGTDAAGGRRLARLPWRTITLVALAVATLVFGGLAAWFGTEAGSLNGEPSAQNLALSDPGETGQVTSQVTSAVSALFSYNYANPAPAQKAASRLLTGSAVSQYTTMIAPVKKDAQKDKLVVTTTVSNIGVEMLTRNTARVLVFATESDGSAGATTPTTAEAMLAVNAVLDGSTWKIEGIDTFSG
jgi:Mce-associated membrane protein